MPSILDLHLISLFRNFTQWNEETYFWFWKDLWELQKRRYVAMDGSVRRRKWGRLLRSAKEQDERSTARTEENGELKGVRAFSSENYPTLRQLSNFFHRLFRKKPFQTNFFFQYRNKNAFLKCVFSFVKKTRLQEEFQNIKIAF